MTHIQSRTHKRSAFTMIELMVVILIIALLVSLLASAVLRVMGEVPKVRTSTEISELSVGLQAFMSDYQLSDPPPSALLLYEDIWQYANNPNINISNNAFAAQSFKFLIKTFTKNLGAQGFVDWNGDLALDGPNGQYTAGSANNAAPWVLEGEQCLIFYLGGIPNTAAMVSGAPPGPQGFSTNNFNPATPGGKRKGPYPTFQTTRLVASQSPNSLGFFVYMDAWQVKGGPKPYAYFSSQGINNTGYLTNTGVVQFPIMDCNSIGATPYWEAQTATTPPIPTQFTFPNTYQIISAGKDGMFGGGLWVPSAGATGNGADDQANFSSTLLGKGQN